VLHILFLEIEEDGDISYQSRTYQPGNLFMIKNVKLR